jgi:hypothetical protein
MPTLWLLKPAVTGEINSGLAVGKITLDITYARPNLKEGATIASVMEKVNIRKAGAAELRGQLASDNPGRCRV